jgi:hypothetical protein
MELEDTLKTWTLQLETAFKPYPEFVEQVTKSIAEVSVQYESFALFQKQASLLQSELDEAKSTLADFQAKAETASRIAAASLAATEEKLKRALSSKNVSDLQESSLGLQSASSLMAAPAAKSTRVLPKTNDLPERTVLLIDDAEINRVLTSHYFKGFPVKLEFAHSVDVAKDKCVGRKYDLILIDDELHDPLTDDLKNAAPHFITIQDLLGKREERLDRLKFYLWNAEEAENSSVNQA